jgi:hypothetical protein
VVGYSINDREESPEKQSQPGDSMKISVVEVEGQEEQVADGQERPVAVSDS